VRCFVLRFMRSEIACPLLYNISCKKISFELCEVPRKAFLTNNCNRTLVVFIPDAYNRAQTARFHFCRRYTWVGGGAEHNVNISFCINPLYVPFVVCWTKYIAPSLTLDLMDQVRYGESIDSVCA
jgi:hypothetical protein